MMRHKARYAFDGNLGKVDSDHGAITLTSITLKNSGEGVNDAGLSERTGDEDKKNDKTLATPKRKIIIEPAFMMIYMFHISSFSLSSQYVYYAIGEKYNLTAVLKAERERLNITSGGNSRCTPEGDGGFHNSTAYDLQQKAQAETATFNFYMDIFSEVPGFFVILFFGTLMDHMGRKPTLIVPLIGIIFRAGTYLIQMIFRLPVEVLFLTGVTDALSGGFGTFLTAGYAYMADTIDKSHRGRRMATSDVAFGLSLSVTSFAMGYMIQYLGFLWPLVIVIAGHLLNLTYILLFVPESRERSSAWRKVSPKYIVESFKVLPKRRPHNGRQLLLIFVVAWLLFGFSRSARGLDSLYKLNSPFCWTPSTLGTYSSVSSILMNVTQIVVALFLFRPLGDLGVLIVSVISSIGDEIVTGFSALVPWLIWTAPFAGCLKGAQMPVMRAILSKRVDSSEQGSLFSSLAALSSILGLGGSYLFNALYASTLYVYKGAVFFVIAFVLATALLFVIIFKYLYEKEERIIKEEEERNVDVKISTETKDERY